MSGHGQVRLADKLQFLKVAHVVKAERLHGNTNVGNGMRLNGDSGPRRSEERKKRLEGTT